MHNHPRPTEIQLHQKSRILEIGFDDGSRFRFPSEYLRVYSPSAEVRGHLPGQEKLQVGKEQVSITDVQAVGNYAVKLFFDDGHKTGIYDWGYLHRLGKERKQFWDEYLQRLQQAGHRRQGADPFAEEQT